MPSSSGAGESDQQREAEGYNDSIYLMIGVPYTLLFAGCFWVYRGLRQKALAEQMASHASAIPAPPTDLRPATGSGGD